MEKPVEVIKHEGLTVKIYTDPNASPPDEYGDNNAFLVHYHRDFWQENKDVLSENDLRDLYLNEKTDKTIELKRKYHIFPVSALIHSGVYLKLGYKGFSSDSGGWGTSHVGAIFLAREEWKAKKKALSFAEGLIEEWNQYLSGEVYGYVVEDVDGEHLDSCWGYYGLEDCIAEGKGSVESHASEILKKKLAKVKAMVKNRVPLERRQREVA